VLSFVLVPFVPHFANEMAQAYGSTSPLEEQRWPAYDPALVIDDVIPYAVQVMGKLRAEIQAPLAATEAEVRALAEANDNVKAAIAGKTVKKFVFVPKRLVNFVVG
jgi:leucyl-tRNA synthetase